jgi:hypothetical protein
LKLPLLLSQFLYQTRKLDLPGIGSFSLDPSVVIPEASDRHMQTPASGITFKNVSVQTPDDALIQFIKDHTGKMKPLAAADLDFFLTTGKQLLNIGKPFYIEGIGTLIKNNEGKFDFTPGEYLTIRLEELTEKKQPATQSFEEAPREYEPSSNNIRQGVLLFGLIAGLILIGWGGYYLYKRNTYVEPTVEIKPAVAIPDSTPQNTDTGKVQSQNLATQAATAQQAAAQPSDTKPATTPTQPAATPTQQPAANIVSTSPDASLYKFIILETDRKGRALRRYNQLLGFQLNIKMDQKDSSYFKLYFPIIATIRDTTHIKDSLADVYAAHVTIEH